MCSIISHKRAANPSDYMIVCHQHKASSYLTWRGHSDVRKLYSDFNTVRLKIKIEWKEANYAILSITSIYQPTNAHIISHKTLLKHFKTLRHVSILSDHHQRALFLAKVILHYSQFNSYLQTWCCGSISCCVGMCCGAVARCASYAALITQHTTHT